MYSGLNTCWICAQSVPTIFCQYHADLFECFDDTSKAIARASFFKRSSLKCGVRDVQYLFARPSIFRRVCADSKRTECFKETYESIQTLGLNVHRQPYATSTVSDRFRYSSLNGTIFSYFEWCAHEVLFQTRLNSTTTRERLKHLTGMQNTLKAIVKTNPKYRIKKM